MAKKYFIVVSIFLFVCIAVPANAAQTTAYATDDTWLNGHVSGQEFTNYGTDSYLYVYGETHSGQNYPAKNSLMRFSLPPLGTGYHIQSAIVRMNYATYENMDSGDYVYVDIYAVRPTRSWTEMGACWYTMDGSSYWAQAGCESATTDRYDTSLGEQLFYRSTAGGDKDWTNSYLTQVVRDWYSGALTNNGLVARTPLHYSGNEGVYFYSNDYGSGWGPRLIITYTLDPVANADGPYFVDPCGIVMFDGSASYDPDGGSITSWLWDIDNDGLYDDGSGSQLVVSYEYLVGTLHLGFGQHTIGLKVIDDEGEWKTATSTLTIESWEGDFEPDGDVDWIDLAKFVSHWLDNCMSPGWCEGTDIDHTGTVDFVDFSVLADNWLKGVE
ncbi:MAG: DNRLRE domain-containing protein [Sedimentisphaerales bacterium]